MPEDIRSKDVRQGLAKSVDEISRRFPDGMMACSQMRLGLTFLGLGIPALDPVEDMKIKGEDLERVVKRIEALQQAKAVHAMDSQENVESLIALCGKKAEVFPSFAHAAYCR